MQQQVNVTSTTDSTEHVAHAKAMYSKTPKAEETTASAKEETLAADKTVEASEAPKEDIKEPGETEADDVDETEDGKEENLEAKPKKKGGFQKRIDKLSKRIADAEAEARVWKEQAMKGTQNPKEEPKKVEAKTESKDGKPSPDDFKNFGDYTEALTDWKLDQRSKAADKAKVVETAKTEYQNKVSSFQTKSKEFVKTAPDFFDTLSEVDHIPLSPALEDLLLQSKNGHELLYDLAKEPEEYERISKLSPSQVYYEMGMRGARLVKPPSSVETKEETKITKAPKPVSPVGKGATVSSKDPGDMSFQEYKAWYAKTYGR